MSNPAGRTTGYSVGYRKPPTHSRFAKGRSGNPKGRPKKAKKQTSANATVVTGLRASTILLDEAYRPVTIREGEKIIELPAIQAVFRAMGVSAMKGDRHAQRMVADLVQQVESAHRQAQHQYTDMMIRYKVILGEKVDEARKTGRPEPNFIPHPDDIIVDVVADTVHVWGPETNEQKQKWDEMLSYREERQREVSRCAQAWRKARNAQRKAYYLEEWHIEQGYFDGINDNLPPRYQVELADRSWRDGASRPGSQKTVIWPGERQPKRKARRN